MYFETLCLDIIILSSLHYYLILLVLFSTCKYHFSWHAVLTYSIGVAVILSNSWNFSQTGSELISFCNNLLGVPVGHSTHSLIWTRVPQGSAVVTAHKKNGFFFTVMRCPKNTMLTAIKFACVQQGGYTFSEAKRSSEIIRTLMRNRFVTISGINITKRQYISRV